MLHLIEWCASMQGSGSISCSCEVPISCWSDRTSCGLMCLQTTKRDIIGVVHIGNTTLDKRVREFATTTAAALTVAEFDEQAEELELETQRLLEEKVCLSVADEPTS